MNKANLVAVLLLLFAVTHARSARPPASQAASDAPQL